jgi:hypothetical protein
LGTELPVGEFPLFLGKGCYLRKRLAASGKLFFGKNLDDCLSTGCLCLQKKTDLVKLGQQNLAG